MYTSYITLPQNLSASPRYLLRFTSILAVFQGGNNWENFLKPKQPEQRHTPDCVCVCVWKHLGTRWNDFSTILQQGAGEGGGGPPANEDTPPTRAFPFFRWIAGAKLRTLSIYFPGTTTTGLFLRWRAILGPCYIYFKWGLLHIDALPRTTPDNHVELSSVCVSPPGATSSRLDGPSEKVRVRKPQLMFPNGTREAIVPWIKGRTAGPLRI